LPFREMSIAPNGQTSRHSRQTMQRWASSSTGPSSDSRRIAAVGQTFTIPAASDGNVPAVDAPGGSRLTEKNQTAAGELLVTPKEAGFYRIRYSNKADFAAVNLTGSESDLKRLDINEFVKTITARIR
jgi:hypothetical protein